MQRDIKFRGKRVDNGEWIYGKPFKINESNKWHIAPLNTNIYQGFKINVMQFEVVEVMSETIGEYTNLKDKNGVEIYEGDIIRLDGEARKLYSAAGATTEEELCRRDCLVGHKDGCFMFGRNKSKADYLNGYLWLANKYCEVIGNIHNNKELLKEEGK